MADDTPHKVVHVTGFGPFPGVPVNPTTSLAASLASHPDVASSSVVRTAIGGASDAIAALAAAHALVPGSDAAGDSAGEAEAAGAIETGTEVARRTTLLLHLGVAASATGVRLEQRAYNEASFRVPDQDGAQLSDEPIDEVMPTESWLETLLPLERIAALMSDAHPDVPIEVSTDAGRYLCNYLYYKSLRLAHGSSNLHSLFVHIPPLSVIAFEAQAEFLAALVDALVDAMP
ncbi:pyrrolidone-carboxylate peptidase [Thecamonas trahens ATCC 50062]|uniref:Pyrrolidone-carboxylate peptidase n=1 Tax=Thecamonas trahens ATCC 50062 TaxID=461836 RepID=A0A0L0DUL7_THETB|nr:pyrrolidone-carboxylate peptidase [Thecamonas trahens ATCC 50062]KNC56029.1 pyrrolidone-carboxylate peptidase [Thecamonas trahens ATCC 50062]|eukprot:XP_013761073.1 pyrrolidone-carboxylate peptidase [Thecamonas trahens ATCC 50062]